MGIEAVTNGEYRLALGTLDEDEMINTFSGSGGVGGLIIRNFPHASPGRPWKFITPDIVTPYTDRVKNGLNQEVFQGKLNFKGWFSVLNDDQLYWLLNTKLGGEPTPLVTIVTRNRTLGASAAARWCTINCKVRVFDINPEAIGSRQREWAVGGQDALTLQFYDGMYAADSGTNFS